MTFPFHLHSSVPADCVYHIFFLLLFAPPLLFFGRGRGETLFSSVALNILASSVTNGLPRWLSDKGSACNSEAAGGAGSIPGSGISLGGGYGNPLQYSCPENPMDGGAWWATVHGVSKRLNMNMNMNMTEAT